MYYHTPHGSHYHVLGCSHLAGHITLSGAEGLLPCSDCCMGEHRCTETAPSVLSDTGMQAGDLTNHQNRNRILSVLYDVGSSRNSNLTSQEYRNIDIVRQSLQHPDYVFESYAAFQQASQTEQAVEYYRILRKCRIVNLEDWYLPTEQQVIECFTKRAEDEERYWYCHHSAYAIDEQNRHRISKHYTHDLTDYELSVLCYSLPDQRARSSCELEIIQEVFEQKLWDIYDNHLVNFGITENEIEQAIDHMRFVSALKLPQILSDIDKQQLQEIAGITINMHQPNRNDISMFVYDHAPDIIHTMIHETCHYLSHRLIQERRMSYTVGNGFSRTTTIRTPPAISRHQESDGFALRTKQEAFNEGMTELIANYLLLHTPAQNISSGYDVLENMCRNIQPIFGSMDEICRDYFNNDWESMEQRFQDTIVEHDSSKASLLTDLIKDLEILNSRYATIQQRLQAEKSALQKTQQAQALFLRGNLV